MVELHELLWEEITQAYPEAEELDPKEIFPQEIFLGSEELARLFNKIEEQGVEIRAQGLELLAQTLFDWREKFAMTLSEQIATNLEDSRALAEEVFSLMK